MSDKPNGAEKMATRRGRVTLPVELLRRAEQIAPETGSSVSGIVAEVLKGGLPLRGASRGSAGVVRSCQTIFAEFSTDEMMILDGIIPEKALHKQGVVTSVALAQRLRGSNLEEREFGSVP